ncbi:hypothetical protein BcepSauron_440 [Burkholderia phage BcepSauron]|uniref:Uncharacterized protein n=1 Tax=Burkholderia phage BcepSauron TaxID=2530033 RepID=A0A482MNW6_9CAUD|nr:hypothetical protein H1O17_gp440 [Burkholderia phage BcepSauron]QBQ74820.1 hypothetical protein BcepSauron_440 [Burkholderia phage BcepSauron]
MIEREIAGPTGTHLRKFVAECVARAGKQVVVITRHPLAEEWAAEMLIPHTCMSWTTVYATGYLKDESALYIVELDPATEDRIRRVIADSKARVWLMHYTTGR